MQGMISNHNLLEGLAWADAVAPQLEQYQIRTRKALGGRAQTMLLPFLSFRCRCSVGGRAPQRNASREPDPTKAAHAPGTIPDEEPGSIIGSSPHVRMDG